MSKQILLLFCFIICAISRDKVVAENTTASITTVESTTTSQTPENTTASTTTEESTTTRQTPENTTASTTTEESTTTSQTPENTTATITTGESTTISQTPENTTALITTEESTTTSQSPVNPARSSSVLEMDTESFGPQFAIDGEISTTDHAFFHSTVEDYPWLEIKLSSPTEISAVQIVNRRDCCGQRLHKAEIRAGDVSVPDGTQSKPLDINNVCGFYEGPGESGLDPVIKCKNTILANYVTVQLMAHQSYLQVNELVFQ